MTTHANRKPVVVGIDGSKTALDAAQWAADLADRMRAPLLVVNTVANLNWYYAGLADPVVTTELPETATELYDFGEATLAKVRDDLAEQHPTLTVSTKLCSGSADLVLTELSEHARMTVIGAHGHGSLDSLLLGSTTLRVANHAHSPVVVWPDSSQRAVAEHAPVLVGVDDASRHGQQAVEHAFEMASLLAAPLTALHVSSSTAEKAGSTLSQCLTHWAERYPAVEVDRIVEHGNPATALLQRADTARLVVVGSRGRNRTLATLLGSTSQNLLHAIEVPLMICRANP